LSKIDELTPIGSSYTGTAKLNAHLGKIEAALQNTLSLDGSSPNEMQANLDMNSNQVINLAEPTLAHSATTKEYVDRLVLGYANSIVGPVVIASTAVGTTLTGSTTETVLGTVTIPAGAMGANGWIRVTTLWNYTSSANTKTLRIRFGGLTGTVYQNLTPTTTLSAMTQRLIMNRNSLSSQIGPAIASQNSFGQQAATLPTSTLNTGVAQDLVITGQLASAAETITLEGYIVELYYKA
jgi:hypothetical protein